MNFPKLAGLEPVGTHAIAAVTVVGPEPDFVFPFNSDGSYWSQCGGPDIGRGCLNEKRSFLRNGISQT